jgi:DNA-binding NarL/FixJ family response regulator
MAANGPCVAGPHDTQNGSACKARTGQTAGEEPVTGTRDAAADIKRADAGTPAAEEGRLRILLVEDHVLVRQALRALLETDGAFEIIGEVGTVAEALDAVERFKPAVAVTDIGLPDRSGIEFATELRARGLSTRVLVLTAHATEEYVKAALVAGVLGYVLKDASHADLVKGLRAVSTGQMFLCVCESAKAPILPELGESPISDREREVLTCIALGYSNKDIARTLDLSVKTIEKHRSNLTHKLDLHGSAALTLFAVNQGLVTVTDVSKSRTHVSVLR